MMIYYQKCSFTKIVLSCLLAAAGLLVPGTPAVGQESPKEEDFFKITKVSAPEGALLEVGGMTVLPNGDLGISTRRGDVFIVENPTSARPFFRKFASGLHEILGLAYKDGAFYAVQRGELTRLKDTDMDGEADDFETVYAWPISGHYHEYSFGPKIASDGTFFVSANVAFGLDGQWWRGDSRVPWRGWVMKISEDGKMEPWATGMRSPAGIGMIEEELFYTDNQGDWHGSGALWHVKKGAFTGHPAGLSWSHMPNSPVKLKTEALYTKVDPRYEPNGRGGYIKPENVVDEEFVTLFEAKEAFPEITLPAVWLPHGVLGISNSEPIKIPEGHFGPFAGQILVGDQGQSLISRVFLEEVNGEYQGASFLFRKGFRSGVLRMAWAKDGSLFVGETNRGWGSAGEANEGLQRLVWNRQLPFEMRAVRAMPDGFEIEFTKPVDRKTAEDIASYSVSSFIYKYHPVYGSPPVNEQESAIKGVKVSPDGMKARIVVDDLRRYYIHKITLHGVRAEENAYELVHPTAYYTLNNIPEGAPLDLETGSTYNSALEAKKQTAAKTGSSRKKAQSASALVTTPDDPRSQVNSEAKQTAEKAPEFAEIKPLLAKNTCTACHNTEKRQIGPAFADVAKRGYSHEEIVELIFNPKPENWPDYATEMPPMPQVPNEEALKIARWINSLNQ
jgi:cytochrome c551/c552